MKSSIKVTYLVFFILSISTGNSLAETMFKDNFQDPNKWEYISDNVMGGVSTGGVQYQNNFAILSLSLIHI